MAQDTASALLCPSRDLADIVRAKLHMPPKPATKKSSLLLVPIIGSNPATGFMFGVGGQYAFQMPASHYYSLISGSIQATTKNQYMFLLKNTIYTKNDKFFLTGDWRFQIFSQSTYGLGTNSPDSGILSYQYSLAGLETNDDSLAQPMQFNFARLHQTVAIRIGKGTYIGLGYQFDGYYKINDKKLRLNPGDTLITSHYAYSKQYGFNTNEYFSSALNATFVMDKRDNMIQPYKGYFLSVGWRGSYKFMGSSKNGSLFETEWRSYYNLSKRNPAHLIAFWLIGEFAPEGEYPYMILPATSYDQRGRSGRGYTQGRFRGNNYVYGETEYRFPISGCKGPLSGVLFLNGTTANNLAQHLDLFESVKAGYGLGLRVMLDKQSRSNLAVDWGFGEKSSGFYLAVSEAF